MTRRSALAAAVAVGFTLVSAAAASGQEPRAIRAAVPLPRGAILSASAAPAISADGRHVAFQAFWRPGRRADVRSDVFLFDRRRGISRRVSVGLGGRTADGWSTDPAISGDGRVVAYASAADNLVRGDTNRAPDVFAWERRTGRTRRVSVDSRSRQVRVRSAGPAVSADGRFVAFTSGAVRLVPGDVNSRRDVFIRDLETGTTRLASAGADGRQGNGHSGSCGAALSADGGVVAFDSRATNLAPVRPSRVRRILVRDLRTGATTAVSEPPGGGRPNGDSCAAALSDDGRVVAYASDAENLAPFDEARDTDVFVHDRATGTTTEVLGHPPPDGPEIDAPEQRPAVSPDGSVVGLGFAANEALTAHVHLFAVMAGTTARAALGVPARFETTDPALSAQGRWVAFASLWPGPGRGDRNQSQDVFVSGPLPLRPTPPPTPGGAR